MDILRKMAFVFAIGLFGGGLFAIGCHDPSGPKEGVCDREKRAVWSALGYPGTPPDSLMKWGEWNIPKSDRGLQGETYYFLEFRGEPGCHVMRA